MQIPNTVVCDARKGCIYKQIKPPLVGEHVFPSTGFVCKEAHVRVPNLGDPNLGDRTQTQVILSDRTILS